jgi:hypothetical protein
MIQSKRVPQLIIQGTRGIMPSDQQAFKRPFYLLEGFFCLLRNQKRAGLSRTDFRPTRLRPELSGVDLLDFHKAEVVALGQRRHARILALSKSRAYGIKSWCLEVSWLTLGHFWKVHG